VPSTGDGFGIGGQLTVAGNTSGQEELAQLFLSAVQAPLSRGEGSSLDVLAAQVAELRVAVASQRERLDENTKATQENTSARLRELAEAGRGLLSELRGRNSAGLGLLASPLAGTLVRLFRRGESNEPPAPPLFSAPPPLRLEASLPVPDAAGLRQVVTGQGGELRVVPAQGTPPPVTIQVQAMDSRSFLDHGDQIARAVREALLNMHPLQDVVGEL
jgi:hypothetical protein